MILLANGGRPVRKVLKKFSNILFNRDIIMFISLLSRCHAESGILLYIS